VGPDHDALAPLRPAQAQRLAPYLLLLARDTLQLARLLLAPALDVLVLPGRPLLLAALGDELGAVLLEGCDGEEGELVVLRDLDAAAGHDHGREGLVALEEVLARAGGHHDEVGLEVFRVRDEDGGVDDRGQGLGGEVAGLLSLQGGEVGLHGVVLVEFGLDVVVDVLEFLADMDVSMCKGVTNTGCDIYIPWSSFLLARPAVGLSCTGPCSS